MPLSVVFILAATAPARVAVLVAEAPGVDAALVSALEETIATEASSHTKAEVMSPAGIRASLSFAQAQLLVGCSHQKCLGQLSELLDAREAIATSVQRVGAKLLCTVDRLDVVARKSIKRLSFETNVDALLVAVRPYVASLYGVAGKLVVWNQPVGAELLVDDRPVGTTPVAVVSLDAPGPHVVRIQGAAVDGWKQEFILQQGGLVRLRANALTFVELEAMARARRNWGGGVLGSAAVVGALSALPWLFAARSDAQLDGLDLRAVAQRDLDRITQTTLGFMLGAIAIDLVAGALASVGIYLLAVNPAAATLSREGIAW